jgi:trehalose 6-phosphate synthase/phosphatase
MPEDEKERKIRRMQNRLARYNVFTWTADFFNQVEAMKKERKLLQVRFLEKDIIVCMTEKYRESKKRLFLIDYDGTLTPIVKFPDMAVLDEKTSQLLKNICLDSSNTIVIVSGRRREFIEEQFRDINAILVAEHGYFIKYPGTDWITSTEVDLLWKEKIRPVLDDYVDRCNGSMVEDKHASIVWHYRNADEEIAILRIHELKDDLTEILKNESRLHVLEGNKVVEIKSLLYDKGTTAARIISSENYDFILALGDDITDEDLFKVIPKTGFSVRVGFNPTNAKYNVRDQSQVAEILSLFAGQMNN